MNVMTHSMQALRDLESDWLTASPRGPQTVRAYRNEIDRLARFLKLRGRENATLDDTLLEQFWSELTRGAWHETRGRPSTSSLDQSRRILSAFVTWMVREEKAPLSALTAVAKWRTPARRVDSESKADLPDRASPLPDLLRVSHLDAAAAALSYWTGATPRELAALSTEDVDTKRATVTFTQRGDAQQVVIPRRLARSLHALLVPGQKWVFRVGAERPTAAAMAQRVARWLASKNAGEVGSARALRSRFQQHARACGWNSDEIRSQLRRPSLPPPALAAPSHRRLNCLLPGSS
jgi:site-specific recombinase XerC